jgi:membrane fusion protein (multidrug efflux system)
VHFIMSAAATSALRDHAPREAPIPVSEVPAPSPVPTKPRFIQRRSTLVFAGLTALAVVGALGAWVMGHGKESTDDAQVEGRVVSVSPRVGGQVEKVLVIDNQSVKQGDCSSSSTPRISMRSSPPRAPTSRRRRPAWPPRR